METKEVIFAQLSANPLLMVSEVGIPRIRNVLRVRKNARNRPDGRGNTALMAGNHARASAESKYFRLDRGPQGGEFEAQHCAAPPARDHFGLLNLRT
jgi:hypothetical protein